jgi:diaminopimelate decarboxylase
MRALDSEPVHLFVEDCDTVRLAERFGTPLYVMSEARLRANCRSIRSAFERSWPHGRIEILPSLKANFVLAVRRLLNEEDVGCDVFGANELAVALRAGVPAASISVNGSAKDAELLRAAVGAGALITLDSASELDIVIAIASQSGKTARIRLRVRPDYPAITERSDFFPAMSISEAAQLYKPGIEPMAARAVGLKALEHPSIEMTGLMTHLGRHSADPEVWGKMAAGFGETVADLCTAWTPWRPRELDIGGGFPAPRDPTHPDRQPAAGFERYAAAVGEQLASALQSGGVDPHGIALQIEPGRSLFADAGVHLSRVAHVKTQMRPTPARWIEVDTTEMFMPDLMIEHAYFRPVFASRTDAAPIGTAHIVGISCGFDLIARDILAPRVEPGDIIAFLDTGAYQDAAATNFNVLARPATVLVSGNRARLVKRRETLDQILGRDDPDAVPEVI